MPGPDLVRDDRFFPLCDAAAYPGSPFLDMVFMLPAQADRTYRLWMLTEAARPEARVNDLRFAPVSEGGQGLRWVDLGTGDLAAALGPRPFGQLRVFGVSPSQARDSWLLVTKQTGKGPCGGIEDAERMFLGLARRDVGATAVVPSSVTVGTPQTYTLRWQSAAEVPPGSRLLLTVPKAFSKPQAEERGKPGWIEVLESDAPLELLSADQSAESHEKYDAIYRLPRGFPCGGRLVLSYFSDFAYLFERTFSGMERRYWYARMPPLALSVAAGEGGSFVPPLEEAGHTVRFVAGPAERLFLFLPGRREAGEPLVLRGVATDRYRNAPPRGEPRLALRLRLEGEESLDLGVPAGHFTGRHRFAMPLPPLKPGIYRAVALDEATGRALARSNPLEVRPAGSGKPNVYWGEIHGHCEMSDGSGGYEEMLRHAREEASLDFAASADHACYFTDNQWRWMQDAVNAANRDGSFVAPIGYEWAGAQGHRNIHTSGDSLDLFRGMYVPTRNLDAVYPHFRGRDDVVAGPHTGHTGDFFAHHDPGVERYLEIYSMWGAFDDLAKELLNKGAVIGFTGGGDCHEGHCWMSAEDPERQGRIPHGFAAVIHHKCGISAAVMDRLTRRDLVGALRDRRTYATTGARVLLDMSVGGVPMGGIGLADGDVDVAVEVHACGEIAEVQIVRDGVMVHSEPGRGLDMRFSWPDADRSPGRHWYFVKAIQKDDERAWSSPVWIERR